MPDAAAPSIDRAFAVGLAASALALAVPPIVFPYLPYLDLPQHLGAVAILANLDPAFAFDHFYRVDLAGSPYLLAYLLAALIAQVTGPSLAVRLLLGVAAGALPVAMAWCLRRFDRDPLPALFVAPLSYGTFAFMGFLPFVVSLPIWLFWLGWWRGAVDRDVFDWRAWLVGGALAVALFYGHVVTLCMACVSGLVVAVMAERTPASERALRLLHLWPGALLLLGWLGFSGVASEGDMGRMVGSTAEFSTPYWAPPWISLRALVEYMVATWRAWTDELMFGLAALAVLVFGIWRRRADGARGPDSQRSSERAARIPWMLVAVAVLLGVALPQTYRGIWPIGARMAPFVALSLMLVPSGRIVAPRLALLAGLLLTGWIATAHTAGFSRFQSEVGGLDAIMQRIAPGSRTMTLVFDRDSAMVHWPVFIHSSQYVVASRGGVAEFSFCNFTKSPIRFAPQTAPPANPVRFEWQPETWDWPSQRDYWDYVLVRGEHDTNVIWKGTAGLLKVATEDRWTLYGRVGK